MSLFWWFPVHRQPPLVLTTSAPCGVIGDVIIPYSTGQLSYWKQPKQMHSRYKRALPQRYWLFLVMPFGTKDNISSSFSHLLCLWPWLLSVLPVVNFLFSFTSLTLPVFALSRAPLPMTCRSVSCYSWLPFLFPPPPTHTVLMCHCLSDLLCPCMCLSVCPGDTAAWSVNSLRWMPLQLAVSWDYVMSSGLCACCTYPNHTSRRFALSWGRHLIWEG